MTTPSDPSTDTAATPTDRAAAPTDWQTIDGQLRDIARRRSALDVDEARWLLVAEESALHRHLGYSSFLEYMERVLGYAPRVALDRLRVARAVTRYPVLRDAMRSGDVCYSAAREIARVITPEKEAAWVDAARSRSLREIEQLVAFRQPGDGPGDPESRDGRPRVLRLELSVETMVLWREAQRAIATECGHPVDDDAVIAALCRGVLDGGAPDDPGRARYQMAITVCEQCKQGWRDGAGMVAPVDASVVEMAECDAQRIGRVDGAAAGRASQDIPPAVRRQVWARDHARCVVPGCRAARNLDIHHIVPRAAGGSHEPANLCVLCSGHHASIHRGDLTLYGRPPELTFRFTNQLAREALSHPEADAVRQTLIGLGFKPHEATLAVRRACAHVGTGSVDELMRIALQQVPKPAAITSASPPAAEATPKPEAA